MFKIFSAPFEGVTSSMNVNDLITSGVPSVEWDEGAYMTAAQIQIPSAAGYTTLYYFSDGYYEDAEGKEAYKPGWCDSDGNIIDLEITPGVAYWFKSVPSEAAPVVAGAVPAEDTADVDCPTGFALRANPYPVATDVNGGKMTSADIVGIEWDEGAYNAASQIQIPTAAGYQTLYYFTDGYYEDAEGKEAYKPGWCDSDGNIVDAVIPVMQGFWTKGVSGAFTLTFSL